MRAAYDFTDLQSFLDLYYAACAVLVTREDFRDLTIAYLRRAERDNVRHVEPFFDPQTHTARGVGFDTVIAGILDGLEYGEREFGITSGLDPELPARLLASSPLRRPCRPPPRGSHGSSRWVSTPRRSAIPPRSSPPCSPAPERSAYALWRTLARRVAPTSWRVRSTCLASRGSITACARATTLRSLLAWRASGVPLTVCPLSNTRLRVFDSMADSTLAQLLHAGVRVTINSDDPAYFGGYIADNFRAAAAALKLTREDLLALSRNAIDGSFAPEARKAQLRAELNAVFG